MRLESWQRELTAALDGTDGAWSSRALRVHRHNVQGARVQALTNTYPVLRRVLGARCFGVLARTYVAAHPSRCADLNRHAPDFPVWLRREQRKQTTLVALPYLGDLARLERAVHDAYYAPDDNTQTEAWRRAQEEPETFYLRLSASFTSIASPWPVDEIWRANRDGRAAGYVRAASCQAMVSRRGGQVCVASVSPEEWNLLKAIRRRESILALAEEGLTAELLNAFLRQGWISGAAAKRLK